jgi:hydrogenase maturation protein HypF
MLLAEVARRVANGESRSSVAAGFHATFCRLAVELTDLVRGERKVVALGGGCAVNRILCSELCRGLEELGLEVLLPHNVPPGDGGLSYGQAVIGAVSAATGEKPHQLTE